MNWGILGTGNIAADFAAALRRVPGARLGGVASRDPARAAAFARDQGGPDAPTTTDAAGLAALAGVDIVYVATPNHRHEADALAVIGAGKPVLVEKPLATNASSARRITQAAEAAGVFAMEGLWSLCQPSYREAFGRIASGGIGETREIMGSFAVPLATDPGSRFRDPAQGGGALLDRGVYLVAVALELLEDPRPVYAKARRAPSGVDEATSFVLEDARGRQALFNVAFDSYGTNEIVVQGSAGRCVFFEPVCDPPGYWLRPRAPMSARPATGFGAALGARLRRFGPLRRLDRGMMRGARWTGGGLGHEIAEVELCLGAGLVESPLVPLARSIRALEILDEIARLSDA